MKNMKKLASLLLALVMVFALAIPAFAATVKNETNHSYDAYQVFKGTQAEGKSELGDIEWGSGVNGTTLLNALKETETFKDCNSAADVAKVLKDKQDNCAEAKLLASIATKHLTTTKTSIAAAATSAELTAGYWLLVDTSTPAAGDAKNAALLQVTNKGDITIAKKYDAPEVEKTVNDNDANIGDTVTFTLTATMPSTLEGYETYKVIFHDTMSAGLTYANNAKVMIDSTDKTSSFTITPAVNEDTGVTTITISCNDVLALGAKESSKIIVTYDAILNEKAVIGTEGNPNKVKLEYSNDPNWDGKGDEPTGNTPEDDVKVFTWEIPVLKVDGQNSETKLAGAEFTLYIDSECKNAVNVVAGEDNIYKVCTKTDCTDHTHVTTITTDETGAFQIEGLQKGTYYLKETKAPAGYNLLTDPVTVVIGESGALTAGGASTSTVTVVNNAGSTLPETGGVGTTLFYVFGGIMMLAAVVLLVTKKRMAA